MSANSMEEYYQKVIHLQEKLRQSEEERLKLEMKYNEMIQTMKEEEEVHFKKLRSKYKQFLEEDRRRQQRNDKILDALERIENRTQMWKTKSEKFKAFKKRYLYCMPPQPSYSGKELKDEREDLKKDVVDDYLKTISSIRPAENAQTSYSNLGNINSMHWNNSKDNEKCDTEKSAFEYSHPLKTTKDLENSLKQNNKPPTLYDYSQYDEFGGNETPMKTSLEVHSELQRLLKDDSSHEYNSVNRKLSSEPLKNITPVPTVRNTTALPKPNVITTYESQFEKKVQSPIRNDDKYVVEAPSSEVKEKPLTHQTDIAKPLQKTVEKPPTYQSDIAKPLQKMINETNHFNTKEPHEETTQQIFDVSLDDSVEQSHVKQDTVIVAKPDSETESHHAIPQTDLPLSNNENVINDTTLSNYKIDTQLTDTGDKDIQETSNPSSAKEDEIKTMQETNFSESNQRLEFTEHQTSITANPTEEYQPINTDTSLLEQQQTEVNQTAQYHEDEQYNQHDPILQQYDENGQPLQSYDESNQHLQEYDENGQPIQYYSDNAPSNQYYNETGGYPQYDENGQLLQQYDENGQLLQQYDENGHLLQQYDENGQYYNSTLQYDENGQPILQYDESGQPLLQYNENGQSIGQYDQNGQLIPQYDENGQVITYSNEQSFLDYHQNDETQPNQEYTEQQEEQHGESEQPQEQENSQLENLENRSEVQEVTPETQTPTTVTDE